MNGLDGMRWLGSDPSRPADDIERVVMLMVSERIVKEVEAQQRGR